jgi:radical SAM protein with 4Fe4S-binding SPASM domain
MNTAAGEMFIRDLADFGVPAILFSGGEPLLRNDLFYLAAFARNSGIRTALSTNGTLIDEETAEKLSHSGFAEVGISLDGIGSNNDRFRGQKGAFENAMTGIRQCVSRGLRVSLRLTLTRFNYEEVPAIFRLVEDEGIDRVCFYHLAYSGRGDNLRSHDLNHAETRSIVDVICQHTLDLHSRGKTKEILMVGNHADGVYLYLKLKKTDPERAQNIFDLLRKNGGNNSGIKIGAVDNLGNVHPDQFWWHHTLGNVRQRKFGEIWLDTSEPLLRGLKDRKPLLKGRCGQCQYLDLCNGNLRVRAEAVFGDVWAEDPACYLTDEEIGVSTC